ncbi:hypothetical protein F3J45_28490 [Pantoea sp. Ap-967]|uniref:hypothetical protein n=1 Tax=Pantoea sp. Ap-967 TaxID=2608362 RepID=UPI001422614B|nr:hypothetical protein [Pantoea sp. Ap-967]NIE78370.1 hypothetical protein [Pantoea sp. Ap-967]
MSNNNQNDIREIKVILLDDFAGSLRKHRRRALVVLIFTLVSALLWLLLSPAPGSVPPALERTYLFVGVAGFALSSTVFLGATVWLSRLTKEREQLMRGE